MPENRYSGSVDEIIENVRRQQEGKKPADDSEVNAILASLGLGEKTPSAPKPDRIADKEPESSEQPAKTAAVTREPSLRAGDTGEIRLGQPGRGKASGGGKRGKARPRRPGSGRAGGRRGRTGGKGPGGQCCCRAAPPF